MKFTQDNTVYTPVTVTFETQKELNDLSNALYEIEIEHLPEKIACIIRDFRVELWDFNTNRI